MKRIFSIAMIAACALMVFSCKNEGKGKDEVKDPAQSAVEAAGSAAQDAAKAASQGARELENAAQGAANRADEDLQRLDDILPYASAEVKPTFNGGDADAFVKYVQENIVYPQRALDRREAGRVTVSFVVDANGNVRNARVVRGVSDALDAEALRVVNSSPAWTPAKQGGVNVPVSYSIPVTFALVD